MEQQMKSINQKACIEASENQQKTRRLNERQWETVVTRLYGDPAAKTAKALATTQNAGKTGKKMASWEVEQTVNRLYQPPENERKEEWLLQQRVEILGKELRAMQSKPVISRTSARMSRGRVHIAERVDDVLAERQEKLQKLIREVEQGGNTNLNHMPYISPRAREKHRTYSDLIQWAANRSERLKQKEEALHVEELSSSFRPMIDEHSSMIASARLSKEGKKKSVVERLYNQRHEASIAQKERAEAIHSDDFRHTSFANH